MGTGPVTQMMRCHVCQQLKCVFDKGTISDAAAHSMYESRAMHFRTVKGGLGLSSRA